MAIDLGLTDIDNISIGTTKINVVSLGETVLFGTLADTPLPASYSGSDTSTGLPLTANFRWQGMNLTINLTSATPRSKIKGTLMGFTGSLGAYTNEFLQEIRWYVYGTLSGSAVERQLYELRFGGYSLHSSGIPIESDTVVAVNHEKITRIEAVYRDTPLPLNLMSGASQTFRYNGVPYTISTTVGPFSVLQIVSSSVIPSDTFNALRIIAFVTYRSRGSQHTAITPLAVTGYGTSTVTFSGTATNLRPSPSNFGGTIHVSRM